MGRTADELVGPLDQHFEAAQAKIVAAPLAQLGRERVIQVPGQERQVLGDELFLQGDGVGADNDALPALGYRQDGRDEIGEALAYASAAYEVEMSPPRVGGKFYRK